MGYSNALTRRHFLRVTGAGVAGAALLGIAACGGPGGLRTGGSRGRR